MKPNIIIFNPDQMRADTLRHLGNEAAYTPNLDAVAADGVSFSNAFCQNPVCVPSRCSFMTGLYPHVRGHRTMSYLLRPGEGNLFSDMKEAGYYTVSSTRCDLMAGQYPKYHRECIDEYIKVKARRGEKSVNFAGERGEESSDIYNSFFDGIIPTKEGETAVNLDDLTVDGAIRRIKNRPKNKPLFMFIGLNYPHPPYQIEEKYLKLIDESKLQKRIPNISDGDGKPSMEEGLRDSLSVSGWSEERLNKIRAVYLAMCAKVDEQFGRVIGALKSEGIYDETAVLFFSDHGDYTTDYGIVEKAQNCFPDCLTNVPLIIKPQKGIDVQSGINGNLAELNDVTATCWALSGISPSRTQFGKSLLPMLDNKSMELHSYVFCEGGRLESEVQASEGEAYRKGDHYAPRIALQMKMPYHTKAVMCRDKAYKYVKRLSERDEFYVLAEGERKNLIDDERYSTEIQRMKNALLDWYAETADTVPTDLDDRFNTEFINNLIYARGFPRVVGSLLKLYLKLSRQSAGEFVNKVRKKYGI